MTAPRKCPPLSGGSIDFAAFHAADRKGADLAQAMADAVVPVAAPAKSDPVKPADKPAGDA